jgi:hypothetical protein
MTSISLEALDDYLGRHMGDEEAEAFEEALFEAAAAGDVRFLDRVARVGRHLDDLRLFDHTFTRRDYEALVAAGRRVELREAGPPGIVENVPPGDVEVVVTRVELGLEGTRHVDVEFEIPDVGVVKTLRDVAIDPEDGALYLACDVNLMRTTLELPRVFNRVVIERNGEREAVAVYDVRCAPR